LGFEGGKGELGGVERKMKKKKQDWGPSERRAKQTSGVDSARKTKKKKRQNFAKNLIRMAPLSLFFDHLPPRPGQRAITQRQLAEGKGPGSEPAARESAEKGEGHMPLSFFFFCFFGAAGEEREREGEIVLPNALPCALAVPFRSLLCILKRRADPRDIRSGDRGLGNARDAVSERRRNRTKSREQKKRKKRLNSSSRFLSLSLSLSFIKNAPKW